MKKIYQKYKDWFVIGLFGLFCLKSCQSCSRSRTIEFADHKHSIEIETLKQENAMIIDSLENHINSLYNENQLYISQINALESTIELYKEENKDLKDNNKHYRNANRVLVNTNNQIINKEN